MSQLFFLKSVLIVILSISIQGYSQDFFEKFGIVPHIKGSDKTDFYNFNSSFSVDDYLDLEKKLKGRFQDKGILFVSYISDYQEKKTILELKDSQNTVSITNKNVIFSDGYENKIESYNGSILSYCFFRDDYGMKNNGVFINKDFINSNNKILEFIYIPEVLGELEREKISTYLSVKYGISLSDSYYISSVGDTIFDPRENIKFSYNITAIGRDDSYGLYQKKSINSASKELTIGVDSSKTFTNNSFLLWSDNGKSTFLKKESSNEELHRIEKVWKTNILGKNKNFNSVNIEVVPEKLFNNYDNYLEKNEKFIWLLKSSTSDFSSDIEYIKQSKKEIDKIIFENIDFSEKLYFTFMIAPDYFINPDKNTTFSDEYTNIEISDRIDIYPNSSKKGELFYVDFNLSEPKEVEIFIYDIAGREIFKTNLYKIHNYKYSNSLQTIGTYLFTIRIKDKILVKKIVIK